MKKIYIQTEGECTWSLERENASDLIYYEEDYVKELLVEARVDQIKNPVHYNPKCSSFVALQSAPVCGVRRGCISQSKDPALTTCPNCIRTDEHKKAMEVLK